MNNPAFNYWLANEANREIGVAIATGQPEHPVYVWCGGEWDSHPNGFQSAGIRNEDAEAIRAYCVNYQHTPDDGDTLIVYVDRHDEMDVRTYTRNGVEWSLTHEKTVDLTAYIAQEVRDALDEDLLAAATHFGLAT